MAPTVYKDTPRRRLLASFLAFMQENYMQHMTLPHKDDILDRFEDFENGITENVLANAVKPENFTNNRTIVKQPRQKAPRPPKPLTERAAR